MAVDGAARTRFLGPETVWEPKPLELTSTLESHLEASSIAGRGEAWAAECCRLHEAQLKDHTASGKARAEAFEPLTRSMGKKKKGEREEMSSAVSGELS